MVLANDLQEVGRVIDTLDVQSHRVMALDVHHISSWCLPEAAISGASFARSCSFTSSRSRPCGLARTSTAPAEATAGTMTRHAV